MNLDIKMHSSLNQTWESEWNWSNVWNVNRTTYGKEPVNDVVPPISRFIRCSCMLRFDLLLLMEHVFSSKSISFETSWKHNFWHSRSSDSSSDPSWFLGKDLHSRHLISMWIWRWQWCYTVILTSIQTQFLPNLYFTVTNPNCTLTLIAHQLILITPWP